MNILITIKDKKVKVSLFQGKKEISSVKINEERSLSEKLLPEIDKLLKRNKLSAKDIKEVRVESDQGETFTTTRLAQTVAKAWNFGV